MRTGEKFRQWQFSKTRLEAFSDAVFAIVMTLLVLELKLPEHMDINNSGEMTQAIVAIRANLYSWAVSFFIVAMIWLHHHQVMNMCTRSDYGSIWINTLLLFFVCLLPFLSKLMGENSHQPIALTIWGCTVSITTLMLTWYYHYNTKYYLSDRYDAARVKKNVRKSLLAGPLLYLAAGLLAWVSIYIAYIIFAIIPLLYLLPLDKEKARASA